MLKYEPSPDEAALKRTLEGLCYRVAVDGILPAETFIHDKDTVIITQGEDVLFLHVAMLVKIVSFLNSQTDPRTGDFIPLTVEKTNVH